MKCPFCGTDNPEEAKFCYNCGKTLRTSNLEELKLASILVLDLKGYSQILSKLGADDTAELIKKLFNIFEEEIERYGGKVIKLLGDGLISAFGVPISFEDYVDRAILSSLAILDKVKEFQKELPEISVRIAISTGKVWQGFLRGDLDLLGDPINEGVHLQNFCPLNRVIVSSNTLKLASKRFSYKKLGNFNIPKLGKEVEVYLITGKEKERKELKSFFVGRKEELKKIEDKLRDIKDKGVLVIIEGEEGIGKSRLVKEIRDKFSEKFLWNKGRSFSYTSNFPYYPILEIIKNLWDIKEEKRVENKIDKNLKEIFSEKESFIPVEYYKSLILSFLFVSKKDLLSQWDQKSKDQLWRILLEEIFIYAIKKSNKPLIIILEDLHWADISTIKILKDIVSIRNSFPISFIFTLRKDKNLHRILKEVSPEVYIVLNPLSLEESTEFLKQNIPNLDINLCKRIIERFSGKPLFLEEISRIIRDKNIKEVEDIFSKIPENIQGIIQARIDSLDSLSKNILQWASIVGRRFSLEDIIAFAKEEYTIEKIKSTLLKLQRLNFIRKDKKKIYTFHHVLTHKVIYESIPRPIRRKLHIAFAESLEKKGKIRDLAYHYLKGENPKAINYLLSLAEISFKSSSYEESLNFCKEVENLINTKFPSEKELLKDIYSIMGDCYTILGDLDKSIKSFEDTLNYIKNNNEEYSEILRKIAWCYSKKGDLEKSLSILEEGENLLKEKESKVLGNILADKAWILFRLRKTEEAINYLKDSIEILEKERDKKALATAYNNLGVIFWNMGDLSSSLEYQRKNLEISEEIKDPIKLFTSYNNMGLIYESMRNMRKAKEYYEKALNICEKIKYPLGIAHSLCNIGSCYLMMGNFNLAENYIKRALDLWESLRVEEWIPLALIYLSDAQIREGKLKEAKITLKRVEEKIKDKKELPERKLWEKNIIRLEFLSRIKRKKNFHDLIESLIKIWDYFKEIKDLENMADTSLLLAEMYKEERNIEKFNFFIENAKEIYKVLNLPREMERIDELKRETERTH